MGLGKSALTYAGAAGIGALAYGIAGLNAEAEGATIGIAGMLQAAGAFRTFEGAMTRSQELMGQLRRDAAALPGTMDDLRRVFQGGLLGGLSAGKTSTEVEHLAAQFMAVSKMLQVDSHVAGRELAMMLEGRSGAHVVMWQRLQPLIGKTAQEFNQMTRPERFEAITRAMTGFDPAIRAYGRSWDAISSTTRDIATNFLRMSSMPLFNAIKQDLFELNDWIGKNQTTVDTWADIVGGKLLRAYQEIKTISIEIFDKAKWVWEHRGEALSAAQRVGTGALIGRAGMGLIGSQGAMNAVGGVLGAGGGVGGLVALGIVGPMVSAALHGQVSLDGIWHKIERAASPLVKGFGDLMVAMEPIGRISWGVFEEMLNIITPLNQALAGFAGGVRSFSEWFQRQHRDQEPGGPPLSEAELNQLRRAYENTDHMDRVLTDVQRRVGGESNLARLGAFADEPEQNSFTPGTPEEPRMMALLPRAFFEMRRMEREQERLNAGTHPQHQTNVNVRIEATINDASDPTRVYGDIRRAVFDGVFRPMDIPKTTVLR